MSYKKIYEFYKNLPETKKEFAKDNYYYRDIFTGDFSCAIGSLNKDLFLKLEDNYNRMDIINLSRSKPEIVLKLEKDFDITLSELYRLQCVNDAFVFIHGVPESPRNRFVRVVEFLEKSLKD